MVNNERKGRKQRIDEKSEEYTWKDRNHKNEGRIHKKFYYIKKGVRQGCEQNPFLFNL